MKKAYFAPKLDVYGNVKSITEGIGTSPTQDAVIFNGQVQQVGFTDGSADIIINTNTP